jgi:hypothetical protein
MKIGIITFHRAQNFGAVMQAYALQEYLRNSGYDAEIIDYRNKYFEKRYSLYDLTFLFDRKNIFASLSVLCNRYLTFRNRFEKKRKYEIFRHDYLRISKKAYYSKNDFGNEYDIYICGSDQIWNPVITRKIDPVYFLAFGTNRKKIAYAASSDLSANKHYERNSALLRDFLNSLDVISVREDSLAVELRKYTKKEIHTAVDPVFLFSRAFYLNILRDPGVQNYILVYHVAESKSASKIARETAKDNNKDLIEIHSNPFPFLDNKIHKHNLGPLDILGYIYYADIIFTNSFHGSALSIIMNKNFYVINSNSSRLKNLLGIFGLEKRFINTISEVNQNSNIDYGMINTRAEQVIALSKKYLSGNL